MTDEGLLDNVGETLRLNFDGRFPDHENVTQIERLGISDEDAGYIADFLACVRILHNCKCMADAATAFVNGDLKSVEENLKWEQLGKRERSLALLLANRMVEYPE